MRKLSIFIVLDVSESMAGNAVKKVQNRIRLLSDALLSDPFAMETVYISLIVFAGKVKTIVPLTCIMDFIPPQLPVTNVLSINLVPSPLAADLLRAEILPHSNDGTNACNILLDWHKKEPANSLIKISLAELDATAKTPAKYFAAIPKKDAFCNFECGYLQSNRRKITECGLFGAPERQVASFGSRVELVLSAASGNIQWLKTLLAMTETIENETPVRTVLPYYRSIVFEKPKLYDCAQNTLVLISRKKKGRDQDLSVAIQEKRAKIFELRGQNSAAEKIRERIYSENPWNTVAAGKINLLKNIA